MPRATVYPALWDSDDKEVQDQVDDIEARIDEIKQLVLELTLDGIESKLVEINERLSSLSSDLY